MGTYSVKSIFLTLQGEGHNAGRRAVFCRFAGCNLWSGREADRSRAVCSFCDTDFVGTDGPRGAKYRRPADLVDEILTSWGSRHRPFVVFTGGEPTLQLDEPLIEALRGFGCELAIETNGTAQVPDGLDWICVSPKSGAPLVQRQGDELKVAWPQRLDLSELELLPFAYRYLQPIDGASLERNTRETVNTCLANPAWRVSLQSHKVLGIP